MNTHQNTKNTTTQLDPANIKPGDTVTAVHEDGDTHTGVVQAVKPHHEWLDMPVIVTRGRFSLPLAPRGAWTLTDHQPAPEPEPEWKPGAVLLGTMSGGKDERFFVISDGALTLVNDEGEWYWPENLLNAREAVVIDPAAMREALAEVLRVKFGGPVEAYTDVAIDVVAALGIEES